MPATRPVVDGSRRCKDIYARHRHFPWPGMRWRSWRSS